MTAMDKYMTVCMVMLVWLTMVHAGVSGVTRRVWDETDFGLEDAKLEKLVEKVDVGLFWFTLSCTEI